MIKVAWHHLYNHPVPENHRFPMEKYDLLPEQLLFEGTLAKENFFEPQTLYYDEAALVHSETYLNKLFTLSLDPTEERRIGFKLSTQLVKRELVIASGTLEASVMALQCGCALNIAGGTHHAGVQSAEGFCLLNDLAIAAAFLLKEKLASKILIIDLDVHQGNGTAQIFKNNDQVFTFSMHGQMNYPMQKEFSDLDIGLKDGTEDQEYLSTLKESLERIERDFNPDFVLYQSGVDVLKTDKLGRLNLSLMGCRERDNLVFKFCKTNQLPIVATMGGGYSEDLRTIIEAHANTFRIASSYYQ